MTAPERVGRRGPVAVICAVSLALVTVVLDFYALTVALPSIADDFGRRPASLHWIITAYLLAFASLTIVGGRLGDAFGRRRVLIAGIVVFGVASIGCGLAPTVAVIVLFRALQGVGAALLFPVGLSALQNAFPPARRAWAVGIVMGVISIGTALGPFVGGVLTEAAVWRLVFLVNVPICIAAIVMVRYAFDESRLSGGTTRIDPLGCVTLTAGLVALTIAVDRAHVYPPAATAALFAAAVVVLGAFVLIERHSRAPLVDMGLVRRPGFAWILVSGCMGNFGWALAVFGATLYMQRVEGFNAIEAGTAFLAMSAGSALGGPLAGRLVPRRGAGPVLILTLTLAAGALVWLATGWPAWSFILALFFTGLLTGTAYSATNIGTMGLAPADETGEASGITITALITTAAIALSIGGPIIDSAPPGQISGNIAASIDLGAAVTLAGAVIMLAAVRRVPRRAATTTPGEPA